MPHSQIGKIKIIKMSVHLKSVYRINEIPLIIPAGFLRVETKNWILKCMWWSAWVDQPVKHPTLDLAHILLNPEPATFICVSRSIRLTIILKALTQGHWLFQKYSRASGPTSDTHSHHISNPRPSKKDLCLTGSSFPFTFPKARIWEDGGPGTFSSGTFVGG